MIQLIKANFDLICFMLHYVSRESSSPEVEVTNRMGGKNSMLSVVLCFLIGFFFFLIWLLLGLFYCSFCSCDRLSFLFLNFFLLGAKNWSSFSLSLINVLIYILMKLE